jgi:hypothetical protein
MLLSREYTARGTVDCAKAILIKHFDQAKLRIHEITEKELDALPINNFLTSQHPLAFASFIKASITEERNENIRIKIIITLRGLEIFALFLWAVLTGFIHLITHWILQISWARAFSVSLKINILITLGIFLLYYLIRLSIEKHLEVMVNEIKSLMQD